MKTRFGFVSNSSSTNFIIGFNNAFCPCCKRKNITFLDNFKNDCDNEIFADGFESVIEKLRNKIESNKKGMKVHGQLPHAKATWLV